MATLKDTRVYGNFRVNLAVVDNNNNSGTSGQVLTSTGTGFQWANNSSSAPVKYFSAAGPPQTGDGGDNTSGLTTAFTTVILSSATAITSGTGDFTISAGGVVTIVNAGVYHVSYSILTDNTQAGENAGSFRSESEAFLRINGTGELNHSQVIMYNREGTEGAATGVKTMLYSATANDTIQIVARLRAANSTNIRILQGQTVLTIYRVA